MLVALILVHEFGHFIVAKRAGMKVEEFGIGFPPRLFALKRGETEYSFNALPFGGFVRIFGEDPEESQGSPECARSFAGKSRGAQALVVMAGVAMNIIAAWVLLSVGYMAGLPSEREGQLSGAVRDIVVTITRVVPDSPAERAGFIPGDKILAIKAGEETVSGALDAEAVRNFIAAHPADEQDIQVKRGKEEISLLATPEKGIAEDRPALGVGLADIGTLTLPPHLALLEGARLTASLTKDTATGLWHFFSGLFLGEADLASVTGPVGLVGVVDEASRFGTAALITLTALISINLAIINLLPFPALDGGRLLLIAIEAVRGVPLPARFVSRYNLAGFLFLIGLMLIVTWSDIARILAH